MLAHFHPFSASADACLLQVSFCFHPPISKYSIFSMFYIVSCVSLQTSLYWLCVVFLNGGLFYFMSKQAAQSTTNQITEGVIWKQLLIFFFPILFGTFFQQLYNTADAIIVGQLCRQGSPCLRWRLCFHHYQPARRLFRRTFFRCNRYHFPVLRRRQQAQGQGFRSYRYCTGHCRGRCHYAARSCFRTLCPDCDGNAGRHPFPFPDLHENLLSRHDSVHDLQHGLRYPARCGRFQTTALFSDRFLSGQHCARPFICRRARHGCFRSCNCDDCVPVFLRDPDTDRPAAHTGFLSPDRFQNPVPPRSFI